MIMFGISIKKVDPNLETKLEDELGLFILKISRAFREFAERSIERGCDAYELLPHYFHKQRRQFMRLTNYLRDFLDNPVDLRLTMTDGVPRRIPVPVFIDYVRRTQSKGSDQKNNTLMLDPVVLSILKQYEITHETDRPMTYNDRLYSHWLVGIGYHHANQNAEEAVPVTVHRTAGSVGLRNPTAAAARSDA
jgi:hypothetical protein